MHATPPDEPGEGNPIWPPLDADLGGQAPGETHEDVAEMSAARRGAEALAKRAGLKGPLSGKDTRVNPAMCYVPRVGDEDLEKLAQPYRASVALLGVLEPIGIVPLRPDTPGEHRYRVLYGRRRTVAALLEGLETIPATLYKVSDIGTESGVAALVTLVENVRRSNAWLTELIALQKLTDAKIAATDKELAAILNVPVPVIRERLKMLRELPQPVLGAALLGRASKESLRMIMRLPASQREEIGDALAASRSPVEDKEILKPANLRQHLSAGQTSLVDSLLEGMNMPSLEPLEETGDEEAPQEREGKRQGPWVGVRRATGRARCELTGLTTALGEVLQTVSPHRAGGSIQAAHRALAAAEFALQELTIYAELLGPGEETRKKGGER